jgi:transposase
LAEKPRSGRRPKLAPASYEQLRVLVSAHPDATLSDLAASRRLGRFPQPLASEWAAGQAWPAAQNKRLIAAARDEVARAAWRAAMADVNPAQLIFLDETSTPTTLTPLRARVARGQRAHGRIPRGRREAIAWLATLTTQGLGESLLVRGAVDRRVVETFGERVLVPTLRPGHLVVLDTRSVHKSATVRACLEAAGCQLVCLPTDSPDLNPIAQAFANIKQALRRVGARSFETVVTAVAMALPIITTADAQAFYADVGFPVP